MWVLPTFTTGLAPSVVASRRRGDGGSLDLQHSAVGRGRRLRELAPPRGRAREIAQPRPRLLAKMLLPFRFEGLPFLLSRFSCANVLRTRRRRRRPEARRGGYPSRAFVLRILLFLLLRLRRNRRRRRPR